MSSLYPERPYQGSPFKRFSTKYNDTFSFQYPSTQSASLTGSPRRVPERGTKVEDSPISRKSPVRTGINRNRYPQQQQQQTPFTSSPTRKANIDLKPRNTAESRDSPVKLRPTSARLARQAEGILSTLDSSSQGTPVKRNMATGTSPGYNKPAVNRYTEENNKENIPKRRKVVKFEDEQAPKGDNSNLEKIVLDLQKQVQTLQRDHSNAITRLQETVDSQATLIEKLLSERRM